MRSPRYPSPRRRDIAPKAERDWSGWITFAIIAVFAIGFLGELANTTAELLKAKAAEIASLP